MRASNRFVRLVAGSAALSMVLASPLVAVAAPRSFQTPTPPPGETVTATPSETVTATPPTEVPTTPTATETVTVVPSETATPPSETATASPSVPSTVDLGVSAEVTPQPAVVNEPLDYTVTITHAGVAASTETEAQLVITYPEFVRYVEEGTNLDNLQFTRDDAKREIRVTYPLQGEKESTEITFVLAATALSQAQGSDTNDIVAAFPIDAINPNDNESREEVIVVDATPTPTATVTATPSATATPTAPPTATPTPTAPSLPTARPTVPPRPAPTTPPTRAASQLDVSVQVVAATNPAIVGGDVVIETTTTNVGAETAGPVVLADTMPSFLQLVEVRSDDLTGYYDVENGTVVVTHPRLAPGRSITTYIVARAVAVSGPRGTATNNNVVSVYADEYGYERTIADDEEVTEIIVATASSTTTTKTTTTTTGGGTTTTTGGSTTTASASPSPPASLPDTGAGNTNTLVLVLAAGTLLGTGVGAQAMLRRRTR